MNSGGGPVGAVKKKGFRGIPGEDPSEPLNNKGSGEFRVRASRSLEITRVPGNSG